VDEELLSLSRTKGALMELFTTPDSEETQGFDSEEKSELDSFWLPDAPVLPPSPEKKKKGQANVIVNLNRNEDTAEASFERRKHALMQYISAVRVASSSPIDELAATPPSAHMTTVTDDTEISHPVFGHIGSNEDTPIDFDMRAGSPDLPDLTGMTPTSVLDSIPELGMSAAVRVASSNSNNGLPAVLPIARVITVTDDNEMPRPVFWQVGGSNEDASIDYNMRAASPDPLDPIGMTPTNGLDSIPELGMSDNEASGDKDETSQVACNSSEEREASLQKSSLMTDSTEGGDRISTPQTLEIKPSTAASVSVYGRRFRRPEPGRAMTGDESEGMYDILSIKQYYDRNSPGKPSAMRSSQYSNTVRPPGERDSTPPSVCSSDSEVLSEHGAGGSIQSQTTLSGASLQMTRGQQQSTPKGISEISLTKSSKGSRQIPKKRRRDSDEDSSSQRRPKRDKQAGNPRDQKGKGVAANLLLTSEQKIMLRDKAAEELY
jgi:hypothetical protein